VVGDAKETLSEFLPKLERKDDRSWREQVEGWIEDWWTLMEDWAMQDGDPINPQRVVWELSKQLPDGCILAADSGSSTTWFARDLRLRKGMQASLSGNLATMGPAVPYAGPVGLQGIRVERPDDLAGAWEEVFAAGRPAVLEAVVDPEIPPLPPHVTGEQMKKMARAMVKGDPDAVGVMEKSLRAK